MSDELSALQNQLNTIDERVFNLANGQSQIIGRLDVLNTIMSTIQNHESRLVALETDIKTKDDISINNKQWVESLTGLPPKRLFVSIVFMGMLLVGSSHYSRYLIGQDIDNKAIIQKSYNDDRGNHQYNSSN